MILNYPNKAALPQLKSEVLCGSSPAYRFLGIVKLGKTL
tara:strand:+ start:779 stop:895 length:117 start_codon:yes stop_codon:yes gene_type:complete